jgi:hypothetical protein
VPRSVVLNIVPSSLAAAAARGDGRAGGDAARGDRYRAAAHRRAECRAAGGDVLGAAAVNPQNPRASLETSTPIRPSCLVGQ